MSSFLFSPSSSTAALLLLFVFFFLSLLIPMSSHSNLHHNRTLHSFNNEEDLDDSPITKSRPPPNKKPISGFPDHENKTKALKSNTTNSTSSSSSNLNKILSNNTTSPTKSKLKKALTTSPATPMNKLNKTATATDRAGNLNAITIRKLKLNKTSSAAKTNTNNSNFIKITPLKSSKTGQVKSLNLTPKIQNTLDAKDPFFSKSQSNHKQKTQSLTMNWHEDADIAGGEKDSFISDFHDLPSRLHSAIVPDLEKLSATSKLYLSKTHRDIAAGVKPFVGNKYAPSIASAASSVLLLLPLLLITALFRQLLRAGTSASLRRALLFVQTYLAVYFATLSLTAVVTGFEPLWFFYATYPNSYAWMQAVQSFGYLVYLVAQMATFNAGEVGRKPGKVVGLAQMLLGLAVGMHYYITVFHCAVTGEAPRANWKVHGIYAACFVVICGLGRAERRKKVYFHGEAGDDGKIN